MRIEGDYLSKVGIPSILSARVEGVEGRGRARAWVEGYLRAQALPPAGWGSTAAVAAPLLLFPPPPPPSTSMSGRQRGSASSCRHPIRASPPFHQTLLPQARAGDGGVVFTPPPLPHSAAATPAAPADAATEARMHGRDKEVWMDRV